MVLIRDFDDLEVYKLTSELSKWVYELTKKFPNEERYNITSQLRRAVASIGANIAEGYGRFHYKENQQFCRQARGSLTETKHFLLLSQNLGFIDKIELDEFLRRYTALKVKLNNYIKSIGPKA